jgi:hypothetical protein
MNRISPEPAGSSPRFVEDAVFFSSGHAVIQAPGRAEALEEARRIHPAAATDGEMAAPTPPGLWPPPELVASLDPLALDRFFADRPVIQWTPAAVTGQLRRIGQEYLAGRHALADRAEALAVLRDVDLLVCRVERARPGASAGIAGVHALLIHAGRVAGHHPRGCNFTYGPANPLGARMRTLTGLDAERELIEGLRAAEVGLETVLYGLATLAHHRLDDPAAVAASRGLRAAWEPMVHSAVRMVRKVPLKVFSYEIIPWLVPVTIDGVEWRAATGAQFSNVLIDWLIWGHETARGDSVYRRYALGLIDEQPPAYRRLSDRAIAACGGASLLTQIESSLHDDLNREAAGRTLDGLDSLLSRIADFRKVHGAFAARSLAMREADVGSGMQTEQQFEPLLGYTRDARARLRAARNDWDARRP